MILNSSVREYGNGSRLVSSSCCECNLEWGYGLDEFRAAYISQASSDLFENESLVLSPQWSRFRACGDFRRASIAERTYQELTHNKTTTPFETYVETMVSNMLSICDHFSLVFWVDV